MPSAYRLSRNCRTSASAARLTTARSLADSPALAVLLERLRDRDQALHQRAALRRSAPPRPRGCWFRERLRVTSPMRTSRLTSRDMVEASIEVMPHRSTWRWLAVVGQRRQHPPHVDAKRVRLQRIGGEALDQREADAIEEVRQVVAEIEMRAFGHGQVPCGSDTDPNSAVENIRDKL